MDSYWLDRIAARNGPGCLAVVLELEAYFDDSGSHPESDVFVVGGWIGEVEAWRQFEQRWQAILDAAGVPFFRSTWLANRKGHFYGWSPERAAALFEELACVLDDTVITGVARIVQHGAYRQVVMNHQAMLRGTELADLPPHLFCLRMCLGKLLGDNGVGKDERVAVFFDQDNRIQDDAHHYCNVLRDHATWGARLGSLTFGSKVDFKGLQAADMIAYESYRHMVNERIAAKTPDLRQPDRDELLRLLGPTHRRISMSYFGPMMLREFVERVKLNGTL